MSFLDNLDKYLNVKVIGAPRTVVPGKEKKPGPEFDLVEFRAVPSYEDGSYWVHRNVLAEIMRLEQKKYALPRGDFGFEEEAHVREVPEPESEPDSSISQF